MIGIINYGMGNLGSVENAFRFINEEAEIFSRSEQIASYDALILPGVGAFGDCMANLRQYGFDEAVCDWAKSGKPLLGICLGLQVLFEESEESPGVQGLGLLPGRVARFPADSGRKVPQMGWNQVTVRNDGCPLFDGIPDESFFYFVHSYYVIPTHKEHTAGTTEYGLNYTSAAFSQSLMATQFHPEKSHDKGLQMLRNFCAWAKKI